MEPSLWQAVLLVVVGGIAGFMNVLAGGGSLLTVPVMVFMGIPGPAANGTNRIAILAQNLSATAAFFNKGFSDFKLSLSLAACALPGAVLGAFLGVQLHGVWFNRILAVIMVGVMVVMYFDKGHSKDNSAGQPTRSQLIRGHLLMIGVGFWGGFIHIGVGFIIMPVLNRVMGLDLVRTNMHKVFIVATYTIAALAVFVSQVPIFWLAGVALAVGTSIGGYVGANMAISRGEQLIRKVLNLVLIVFIIKLLFFS